MFSKIKTDKTMNYFLNLLIEGRVHLYKYSQGVMQRIYQCGICEQHQSKYVSNYYGNKRLSKNYVEQIYNK